MLPLEVTLSVSFHVTRQDTSAGELYSAVGDWPLQQDSDVLCNPDLFPFCSIKSHQCFLTVMVLLNLCVSILFISEDAFLAKG